jgi:hypothetical protein
VAGLPSGPLASWGGDFGPFVPNGSFGSNEIESADFNGDDSPDFVGGGFNSSPQGAIAAFLLINNGQGVFSRNSFGGISMDEWINQADITPTGINHAPDACLSADPGDFDADGKMDVVMETANGQTPRYLWNTTAGGVLSFADRTSVGDNPPASGEAAPDAISWLAGWAADGSVNDFDGDGLPDLFIANHDRTTQSELLISTTTDPTSARISRVLPATGQVTGRVLRIRGVHFSSPTLVTTVWFEKITGATVSVSGTGVTVTDKEVSVVMPAGVSLGMGRVSVGTSTAPLSNKYQFTHLDAAPVPTTFSTSSNFGFKATDADGFADLKLDSWRITRKRGTTTTTWAWDDVGVWSQTTPGQSSLKLTAANSVKQSGDVFTFEVGDTKAAYGKLVLQIP